MPLARPSCQNTAPWWCRPLVGILFLFQPPIRAWYRATFDLKMLRPHLRESYYDVKAETKLYRRATVICIGSAIEAWDAKNCSTMLWRKPRIWAGSGVFNNGWATWDVKLVGDLWHTLVLHTASEELGSNRRFTRSRITLSQPVVNRVVSIAS